MKVIDGDLDLAEFLRPGDRIVLGNACGEPVTLVEALLTQAGSIGGLSAFIATSFSGLFTPEAAAGLEMLSMGAIGALRTLARAGRLGVIPCHLGQVGPMIEAGLIGCDVAFVQVSPAGEEGNHSLGLVSDHVRAAVARARVVVAEVNDQVPFTYGERLAADEIDYAVPQCEWLRQMPVRTEAVRMLRFLADALEAGTQPFTWLHREDPDHG